MNMRKMILLWVACSMTLVAWCPPSIRPNKHTVEKRIHNAKWERMVQAITYVESRNDDEAYNKASGALGRFQMKKIYVDDVNRIQGLKKAKKRYRYSDRTDPKKSREMFDILQGYYNPEKNISKAIRLHRGKDSKPYREEIYKKMKH